MTTRSLTRSLTRNITPAIPQGLTVRRRHGFLPPDLADLLLWYDANDASTIAHSGGAVSQWDDKSGNDRHATQGTGGAQPTTNSTTQNSKNVLAFDGGDYMTFTMTHSGSYSVIAVVKANTTANGVYQFGALNQAGSLFSESSNFKFRPAGGANATAAHSSAVPTLLVGTQETNDVNLWRNGTLGTPATTGVGSASSLSSTLGGLSSSVYRLSGWIAELIVYDGVLSDADRETVQAYANDKWAIY